jgi:hypothetical protein
MKLVQDRLIQLLSQTQLPTQAVVRVSPRLLYLDEINDFPTICMSGSPTIDFQYLQTRQPLKTMRQLLRGYTYSDDALRDAEDLARDIERVVQNFAASASDLGVYSARVQSINTDEGLLQPYGLCEVEVAIDYED